MTPLKQLLFVKFQAICHLICFWIQGKKIMQKFKEGFEDNIFSKVFNMKDKLLS